MRLAVALALWSTVAVAEAPNPPPTPKIAVLAVHADTGVSQGSANLLLEILTSDIQQSGKFDVISAADIAAMVGYERQKKLIGCTEESCLSEIGSAIGADKVLDTSVGTIGNLRVLAIKLIDVKAGKVSRRETETLADDNALVDAGHRLVAKVLDLTPPPSKSSTRRGVGVGLAVGGVALAAGGIVFGVIAEGQLGNYRTTADPGAASSARTSANVADALYGTAIVAGVVGAILFLTGAPAEGAKP